MYFGRGLNLENSREVSFLLNIERNARFREVERNLMKMSFLESSELSGIPIKTTKTVGRNTKDAVHISSRGLDRNTL